ncbi:MAG: DUF86 domain-containing protein [Magnetococcales bacterium]|nr:DUF86 domain-containing protein [Magnetococcales bacterium]
MPDDVLLNETAIIERCMTRAREEYAKQPATFEADSTRQDAAILNIQRGCQAAIDLGHHLIRRERLGLPQGSRELFALPAREGRIDPALAGSLQRMAGFGNIAVHDCLTVHLPTLVVIIAERLNDLLAFSQTLLRQEGAFSS